MTLCLRIIVALLAGIWLAADSAAAQQESLVGSWRGQITVPAEGGLEMLVSMEEIFQANGQFSALTTSRYANGPVAGRMIGALQEQGTYRVDPSQGVIAFHITKHSSTGKTTVPSDEYDRYQFQSPAVFLLQGLNGGPVITFQRVQ